MTRSEDPWLWTVDEVVAQICGSLALFHAIGCGAEDYPDQGTLEHYLRYEGVTGQILLTGLNLTSLQTRLCIHQPGQRKALFSVIAQLQYRSFTYRQHGTTVGIAKLDLQYPSQVRTDDSINPSSGIAPLDEAAHKRQKGNYASTRLQPTIIHEVPVASTSEHAGPENTALQPNQSQWDHLLRWQLLDGDEEVDIMDLDDSESEEQYDAIEGALEEIDEAADGTEENEVLPEQGPGRSRMTQDAVVNIINECIEHYIQSWVPNKRYEGMSRDEEISYDPERMWEDAENLGQRQQLIAKHEADLAYYSQRLDILCDEILKFPGSSAATVRRQCKNLELTVDSMELAEWLLSIYKLGPVSDSDEDDIMVEPSLPGQTRPTVDPSGLIDLGAPMSPAFDNDNNDQATIELHDDLVTIREQECSQPDEARADLNNVLNSIEESFPSFSEPQSSNLASNSIFNHGDEPEIASITTIRRWRWMDLTGTQDRKRVVSKAILELRSEDREMIRSRLNLVGKVSMQGEMLACIDMMTRGDARMNGVLPRDQQKITVFTNLFVSWWLCDDYVTKTPKKAELEELAHCLQQSSPDPDKFYDYLFMVMSTTFSIEALKNPDRPSQAEVIEISDDDDIHDETLELEKHELEEHELEKHESQQQAIEQHEASQQIVLGSQQDCAIMLD